MNEILQKRIEEAAKRYCQDKNYMQPLDTEPSLETLTAIDAFIKGTEWLLEHMWISVDEALPDREDYDEKLSVNVFVTTKDCMYYAYYHYGDNTWRFVDGGCEIPAYVTNWMSIPKLKGGEK